MDDLAPAPAQRTSDDSGLESERRFAGRKNAVKKVKTLPAQPPEPEPEATPEGESDHQIDVLA